MIVRTNIQDTNAPTATVIEIATWIIALTDITMPAMTLIVKLPLALAHEIAFKTSLSSDGLTPTSLTWPKPTWTLGKLMQSQRRPT
ncbi:hypothetical protein Syun_009379 [Stephania yunnanensis]|uniref:Uncharacterized protein n=1 Tax=Stephania yunnanensis TaxID=152371 RepID=A0AAP0KFG0_9MAGN